MIPAGSIRLLQTQSDERLLASARGGHEPAFEELVHRYRKPLLAHVRRLLPPAKVLGDALAGDGGVTGVDDEGW
jgi:hypothetical protein